MPSPDERTEKKFLGGGLSPLPDPIPFNIPKLKIAPAHHWVRARSEYEDEWRTAWHSGRTSVFGRQTFPLLRSTCIWPVTSYMGKSSATGQPTRPTQPFILSGSINEKWAAIGCPLCCRHLVNAYGVKAWCGWLGRWCVRWLLTANPVIR